MPCYFYIHGHGLFNTHTETNKLSTYLPDCTALQKIRWSSSSLIQILLKYIKSNKISHLFPLIQYSFFFSWAWQFSMIKEIFLAIKHTSFCVINRARNFPTKLQKSISDKENVLSHSDFLLKHTSISFPFVQQMCASYSGCLKSRSFLTVIGLNVCNQGLI